MWGENVWKVFSSSSSRGRKGASLLPTLILELKGESKMNEEYLRYNSNMLDKTSVKQSLMAPKPYLSERRRAVLKP